MNNIIAIVWDFDKTLVNKYMQTPIFEEYGINQEEFWTEVNALGEKYKKEQNVKINPDTIYLNHILKYVREEKLKNLNNKKLREFGTKQDFYEGIPEIFEDTKNLPNKFTNEIASNIKIEHYIVSTGLTEIIRGSMIKDYVKDIWGCEFIEDVNKKSGKSIISEIGYTIDNTSKTRALFEINKGANTIENIEVNTNIDKNIRRVPFENIIYIADGPSDVPAFSVVKERGGHTFAVYPKNNQKAFNQVEQLRNDGRIEMYAEANYSKGTQAYMWITSTVEKIIMKIANKEIELIEKSISNPPKHLN